MLFGLQNLGSLGASQKVPARRIVEHGHNPVKDSNKQHQQYEIGSIWGRLQEIFTAAATVTHIENKPTRIHLIKSIATGVRLFSSGAYANINNIVVYKRVRMCAHALVCSQVDYWN